jgi:hypothetical protein
VKDMTSFNKALIAVPLGILFSGFGLIPAASSAFRGQPLPQGLWGGEHIRMEVTAEQTKIEYDCAHATVSSRIVLDPRGRFVVKGTYFEEHGGPSRQGEEGHGYPVQFRGTVKRKDMKLTVTRTDTQQLIGTYSLTHGREAELVKCR